MTFKFIDLKRLLLSLFAAVFFLILTWSSYNTETRTLVLYYSVECPHCKDVLSYAQFLKLRRPIIYREVYVDERNFEEFLKLAKRLRIDTLRVPALYDPRLDKLFIGDQEVIKYLEKSKR